MTILPNDVLHQAYTHLASVSDDDGLCAWVIRPVTTIDEACYLITLSENDGVSLADFEYWPLWALWGEDGTHSA